MKRFREWLADCIDWLACRMWEMARWIRPPLTGPTCPDCNLPECMCDELADRTRMLDDQYHGGYVDGYSDSIHFKFEPVPNPEESKP